MSSCSVYGNNNKLIDETTMPRPISLYSKLCLEYEKYLKTEKNKFYYIKAWNFVWLVTKNEIRHSN